MTIMDTMPTATALPTNTLLLAGFIRNCLEEAEGAQSLDEARIRLRAAFQYVDTLMAEANKAAAEIGSLTDLLGDDDRGVT